MRLGLCCTFLQEPIRFSNTTVTAISRLPRAEALSKLSRLCLQNARALALAIEYCATHRIGCFRVNSQILPVKTHLTVGYRLEDLPASDEIRQAFERCNALRELGRLRLTFHPDQFVVLNSPREEVVAASLRELEYQAEVADWIGADVVNIHGGGAYGDKVRALEAFARNADRLSPRARQKLTVENDDKTYTPRDLLPLCKALGIPLVYDVHHHRCLPDGLTVEEATEAAIATWNREPLFHISSPQAGWEGPHPERHHAEINPADVPADWIARRVTVEVEAKAKEQAVLNLMGWMIARRDQDLKLKRGRSKPAGE